MCPFVLFSGGWGEGEEGWVWKQGFSFLLQEKDPKAAKVWPFLKLLGDFQDFPDEVTHFIAKIPVRIYFWAGRWEQSL